MVSGIRAAEPADLPAISQLYERVARSGSAVPPPGLSDYFRRTLFDHPWADPEIPSLVYTDRDGRIVGFLGSHVRRLRVDGRGVRMGCSGQLVAAPETGNRGAGALLMRQYMAGPQELTITDGATETVRRMWTALGGQPLVHASIGWTKILKPGRAAAAWLSGRPSRPVLKRVARLAAPVVDPAIGALLKRKKGFAPAPVGATAEPLTPEFLVEQVDAAVRRLRVCPDYDVQYARWLFAELDAVGVRGTPVRALLRDRGGRVLGWYVYYLPPGGIAQVLAAVATDGEVGLVLDHIFQDAAQGGAVAVQGRIEPAALGALHERRCLLTRSAWALVHTADSTLMSLLPTAKSQLTRLDGEWWMGHHVLWPRASRTGGSGRNGAPPETGFHP